MEEDCKYYNEFIRCYRDGKVERLWKRKGWCIVENTVNSQGYNEIRINGKKIKRHRLIAYCFLGLTNIVGKSGADDCIDHLNGNRTDNRVENLRITTNQGNNQNNTKAKGYCWRKLANKWHSRIRVDKKQIHLGYYDTQEEARNAYLTAKAKHHKFMVN